MSKCTNAKMHKCQNIKMCKISKYRNVKMPNIKIWTWLGQQCFYLCIISPFANPREWNESIRYFRFVVQCHLKAQNGQSIKITSIVTSTWTPWNPTFERQVAFKTRPFTLISVIVQYRRCDSLKGEREQRLNNQNHGIILCFFGPSSWEKQPSLHYESQEWSYSMPSFLYNREEECIVLSIKLLS